MTAPTETIGDGRQTLIECGRGRLLYRLLISLPVAHIPRHDFIWYKGGAIGDFIPMGKVIQPTFIGTQRMLALALLLQVIELLLSDSWVCGYIHFEIKIIMLRQFGGLTSRTSDGLVWKPDWHLGHFTS